MSEGKAKLLRETAEIAFTEIKRFLEPRLMDRFSSTQTDYGSAVSVSGVSVARW